MALGDFCRRLGDCGDGEACIDGECQLIFREDGVFTTTRSTPVTGFGTSVGTATSSAGRISSDQTVSATGGSGVDQEAKLRCCGPSTNFICVETLAIGACPRGSSECDVPGESCATNTTTTTSSSGGGLCQADGDCPTGFSCDTSNPIFSEDLTNPFGRCVQQTTTPTPTLTSTATTPTSACTPPTFQCGPTVQVDATTTNTTCCNPGDYCCTDASGNGYCSATPCPTPPPPICNYKKTTISCAQYLSGDYTGNVVITESIGPEGCVDDPQVDLSINTGTCTPVEAEVCEYVDEERSCADVYNDITYTGTLTRTVIRTDASDRPLPLGCVRNPSINTNWQGTCTKVTDPPLPEQYRICTDSLPLQYVTNVSGLGLTSDTYGGCYDTTWVFCGNPTFNNRGTPPLNYVFNANNNCYALPPEVIPPEIIAPTVVGSCTPPRSGFNRTIDVACTTLGSQYAGGIAKQAQVRSYNATGPVGSICEYTDWVNSGTLDVSACQVPNRPVTCTPPSGPSTREIDVPCSQIDTRYTRGSAKQKQTRRVDTTATGPGTCPFTWENSGAPDTTLCQIPVFWRNCVTGELIEGTPPVNFVETAYERGGLCWEPLTDLGFNPSLTQALQYKYQRGSSKYPDTKTIAISNTSYGQTYAVKITTNENITLFTNKSQKAKGTLTFNIAPRSEVNLSVLITPELLQQLQDGMSTLSMSVEYDRVL